MIYSKRFRVPVLGWIALSSVLGFGFTFWGFGSVPFSSHEALEPIAIDSYALADVEGGAGVLLPIFPFSLLPVLFFFPFSSLGLGLVDIRVC